MSATGQFPPRTSWMLAGLRILLPWLMLLVLLAGIGAGLRLASYVDQPFAGFPFIWRKEYKLYTVGWMTPAYWSGLRTGLRVNDRILCINDYIPKKTEVYGLDEHYPDGYKGCKNGDGNFGDIFRKTYAAGSPAYVEFTIDRNSTYPTVQVPLVLFDWDMLFDILLPLFMPGISLLILAWVVYRANPRGAPNLYFAFLLTIVASFVMNQLALGVYSDIMEETRYWTLLMVVPWIPMLGALSFNLFELLTRPGPLSRFAVYVRRPFSIFCLGVSALGIFNYLLSTNPITYPLAWAYNIFMASSFTLGAILGGIGILWAWQYGATRRIRMRSRLILICLLLAFGITVPFIVLVFIPGHFRTDVLQPIPYWGLAMIGLVIYAILRYQLFAVKTRILVNLLILIICTLVADLIHSMPGASIPLLPIWLGSILTGILLEGRWRSVGLFDRLFRREITNYQMVVNFNRQTGGLLNIQSLIQAASDSLGKSLNTDRVEVCLHSETESTWHYFINGVFLPLPEPLTPELLDREFIISISPERPATSLRSVFGAPETPGAAIWLPLKGPEHPLGLLRLGERISGETYNEEDLRLVAILANQLALSVSNTYQFERLQAIQRRLLQAEENERTKVARELHDTVLQFLLVLNYGLDDLKDRSPDLSGEIEVWQERISTESNQLRDLLGYLRSPEILVRHGLVPSLQSWIEPIRRETQIPLDVQLDPTAGERLTVEAQIALYRVFRESIHNAIKHSHAKSIQARLEPRDAQIYFEIRDDGIGFNLDEKLNAVDKPYRSLQDMMTYIESSGGHVKIETAPGAGTSIQGCFPVQ